MILYHSSCVTIKPPLLFNKHLASGTYLPRKEIVVDETIRATVIRPNQSIKLRARKETLDRDGNQRVTGEEWMVPKVGAYLPGAYEEVVDVVDAYVLTEKVCSLHGCLLSERIVPRVVVIVGIRLWLKLF